MKPYYCRKCVMRLLQVVALGYGVFCYLQFGKTSLGLGAVFITVSITLLVESIDHMVTRLEEIIGILGRRARDREL